MEGTYLVYYFWLKYLMKRGLEEGTGITGTGVSTVGADTVGAGTVGAGTVGAVTVGDTTGGPDTSETTLGGSFDSSNTFGTGKGVPVLATFASGLDKVEACCLFHIGPS